MSLKNILQTNKFDLFCHNMTVANDLTIINDITIAGDLAIDGDIAVVGDELIGGTLTVTGQTVLNGAAVFTGATTFRSDTFVVNPTYNALAVGNITIEVTRIGNVVNMYIPPFSSAVNAASFFTIPIGDMTAVYNPAHPFIVGCMVYDNNVSATGYLSFVPNVAPALNVFELHHTAGAALSANDTFTAAGNNKGLLAAPGGLYISYKAA